MRLLAMPFKYCHQLERKGPTRPLCRLRELSHSVIEVHPVRACETIRIHCNL